MTLDSQLIRGSQAGRAAADDGDLLTGSRSHGGLIGVAGCQIVIGSKGLHISDGQRCFHQTAAAVCLTGMGANTANGCRQGNLFLDDLDRFTVIAQSDLLHIALRIGLSRAAQNTGTLAVAFMVRHEQFQSDLSGLTDTLGVGMDDLAVLRNGCAGTQQLGNILHFHHAQTAGAIDLQVLVITKVGDLDAVLGGNGQDGITGFADALATVNDNLDISHCSRLLILR